MTVICLRKAWSTTGLKLENWIGFFAPDPRYAADAANGLRGFKELVARSHKVGLKTVLDVVYNHAVGR